MPTTERFLVDYLSEADMHAPTPAHVEIQRVIVNRDSRTALFMHPDSSVLFPSVHLGKHPSLDSAICIKEHVWEKCTGTIFFEVKVVPETGIEKVVYSRRVQTATRTEDRSWIPVDIDLSEWTDQTIQLQFSTRAEGSHAYAWASWANPILTDERPVARKQSRTDDHTHILLISSDALSRYLLGCYGNTKVATPHIDAFASESTLFEQACSQSTCTLGAYASMLSGMSPGEHGLQTEWGKYPSGVPGLPQLLHARGFHTTFLASENELNRAPFGFKQLFNQSIDAICNPAQDGAITVRSFKRYWEHRPDQPTFTWVQFFDTHPPSLPPRALSKKYYPGDPEQEGFLPELVGHVYGLESLVEMERMMPLVLGGQALPGQARERFLATARALQGKQDNGPDLYEHLVHLPETARLGMSPNAFGYWLEKETRNYMSNKKASRAFQDWCSIIIADMQFIQESITGWLKGVKDFNYAISQYQAATTYFDQHFGQLIDHLKETGTYDQTLIVLTSPHGELLKFEDVAFHHHLPHPYVYEVPLIVKAPGQQQAHRLRGITEHRDLLPSILESVQESGWVPAGCSGNSWWPNVTQGTDFPRTNSIGYDINSILCSLYHPPHLFVRTHDAYQISESWFGQAGEEFLFERTDELDGMRTVDDPEKMAELRSLYEAAVKAINAGKKQVRP